MGLLLSGVTDTVSKIKEQGDCLGAVEVVIHGIAEAFFHVEDLRKSNLCTLQGEEIYRG